MIFNDIALAFILKKISDWWLNFRNIMKEAACYVFLATSILLIFGYLNRKQQCENEKTV